MIAGTSRSDNAINNNKINTVYTSIFLLCGYKKGVPGKGSVGGLPEGGGPDGGPLPAEEELTPAVGG